MVTLEQLRLAAEKAGMAKFYTSQKNSENVDNTPYVIGHDFLERLHVQLEKINVQVSNHKV